MEGERQAEPVEPEARAVGAYEIGVDSLQRLVNFIQTPEARKRMAEDPKFAGAMYSAIGQIAGSLATVEGLAHNTAMLKKASEQKIIPVSGRLR